VTQKQCLGCALVLETEPETCAEVYETCFIGSGLQEKVSSVRIGAEGDSGVQITLQEGVRVQEGDGEAGGGSVVVGREGIRIQAGGSGGGSVEIGRGGVSIKERGEGSDSAKTPDLQEKALPSPPPAEETASVVCSTNEDCATGKNGQYRLECAGSNCNLFCGEGSECAVACESNCDIDAAEGSRAEISCGANCDVTCAPGATCIVDCPGGNCFCEGPGCRRAS